MRIPLAKRFGPALGVATLFALGLATAQDGDSYLTLRTPQSAITARVTGDDITSPEIQLTRDGNSLRGRALGQVVFLDLTPRQVGGTVGGQLARLQLTEEASGTTARGNFLGTLTDLNFGPRALHGTVGRCSYDLKVTQAGSYEGSRSCGGIPQRPVILNIPPALAQQGTPMTLTTLALLLASY